MKFYRKSYAPMGDTMGYKIVYGRKPPPKRNLVRIQTLICLCLLAFALCVRLSWPEGTKVMRQVLVSEQLSQEAEAFLGMIQQVRAGEPLTDAVAVFCQEIFHG